MTEQKEQIIEINRISGEQTRRIGTREDTGNMQEQCQDWGAQCNVLAETLKARFLSVKDCMIEIKLVRTSLQCLFSASKSVLSAWSMILPACRRSSESFQVAM